MNPSGEIEAASIAEPAASAPAARPRDGSLIPQYLQGAGIVGIATLVALTLRSHLAATNLAMVYLLGVVAVALRSSRQVSVVYSFLSVAAFDFFCVPPYLTFGVSDYEYLVTFASMLTVALVISTQTARIRAQVASAVDRESRTKALYRLSRSLAAQTRVFDAARAAAEVAEEVFDARVLIFLPDQGRISFRRRTSDQLPVATSEEEIAQWVFDHGRKAGKGMETMPDAAAFYYPLKSVHRIVGVMCVRPEGNERVLDADQQHLLNLFANQTAVAIDRTLSQNAAETARMQAQTEEMRSSLLSAVSHDLRTPLASITGAASTLRVQGDKLPPETRDELLESISDEADRLGRLVGNLLDMTRLETGVELRRDYCPLEEIIGTALQRLETQLAGRHVTAELPDNLPAVYVDDVLFGQVVVNLLENAAKYTPLESAIEINAGQQDDAVVLEVRDHGPGFVAGDEQRIFEKFYRGGSRPELQRSRTEPGGAGLGLAICRAIVAAHQGSIEALNRPGGGAIFRIRLPLVFL